MWYVNLPSISCDLLCFLDFSLHSFCEIGTSFKNLVQVRVQRHPGATRVQVATIGTTAEVYVLVLLYADTDHV